MSVYNFHLVDHVLRSLPEVWGEGTAYVVGLYLKEFFDEVCTSPSTSFASSDFHWNTAAEYLRPPEVVIHFLTEKSDSLVRKISSGAQLGPGGTTRIHASGNLSEVYVRESLVAMGGGADIARGLAVLAFHEAMHNKLQLGNSLHSKGGGGMAATTVYANTELNQPNIAKMAKALETAVPQNTEYMSTSP